MSKIIDATCSDDGVVTSEGFEISNALILSEGTKESEGVLLLQANKPTYITSNASDIKELIESLVEIINQIATILSGLDAVSTSPGSVTSMITQLQNLKTEFEQTKDSLK